MLLPSETGLNEAAVAALKLLQEWECQRHPRRWPARLQPRDLTEPSRLNEAAGAALKLLQQWECQRHPRRRSARLEGIDRCSRINDDGDQHDRDTSKGR